MTLNIEVKADVDGLRLLAEWLDNGSEAVHHAGSAAIGARSDAERDWNGGSGEAFQDVMARAARGIDDVASDMAAARDSVTAFADDMDTVLARMAQARQVAEQAGLEVVGVEIRDPGPAPAAPPPLPAAGSATPEQQREHTAAQSAVDIHQAKVNAYDQASQIVNEARGTESAAVRQLAKFGNEQLGKAPFTFADISSGLAGEAIKRTSKFRALAASYGRYAECALRLTAGKAVTDPAFVRAARLHAQFAAKQGALLDDAARTLPARTLDKLPGWAKRGLTTHVDDFALKGGSTAGRVGKAIFGKVPIAGLFITAASTGYDISQGKNPVQSVASGLSGLASGAAVGSLIGGPLGIVAGGIVGAGVGYVVDEWGDEIAGAVGDAAEAVGGAIADAAEGVGDAVTGAAEAVGGGQLAYGAKGVGKVVGESF